jgi:hypothetical protein
MNGSKKLTRILYSITIGWLLVRLIFLFFIPDPSLFEVHTIAVNMVQTGEMKYFLNGQWNYNYQFPIYPGILYFLYAVFGVSPKLAIIFNCILHSIAGIAGFHFFQLVGTRFNHPKWQKHISTISLLGALALLFHPVVNHYTLLMVHPFALDLSLMMICLWMMMRYFDKPSLQRLIIYAILFGIAVLNRTSMLVLIVPFFILFLKQNSVINGIKKTGIVVLIGLLISLPWLLRNYTIYHAVSINSSFGQNLWLGIQEETGGSAYLNNGQTYYHLLSNDEWKRMGKLNPVEQSNEFLKKYRATMQEDPGLIVKMFGIKMKNFWWFRQGIGTEYSPAMKAWMPVYQVVYVMILILAVLCMILLRKNLTYLIGFLITFSIFQSLFYVETRHRIIIEPILIWMGMLVVYHWLTTRIKKG